MKKMVTIFLALFVCVSSMGMFGIFAVDEPTVQASSVEGMAGENVEVALTLTNNPGVSYMKLKVQYDANALTLKDVVNTNALEGEGGSAIFTKSQNATDNPYILSWANASNLTGTGVIAKLTFTIQAGAQDGNYPITVTCEDCNNQDLADVAIGVGNGNISVSSDFPKIYIPNVEGKIGDQVTVDVSIGNNPGIGYLKMKVGYDNTKLKLLSGQRGDIFREGSFTPAQNLDVNPYIITWTWGTGNSTENGVFYRLTFQILDNTAGIGTTDLDVQLFDIQAVNMSGGSDQIVDQFKDIDSIVTIKDVDDHEHVFGPWTKTDDDLHQRTCSECNRTYYEEHNWNNGEITKAVTCTENGIKTYTCSVCNATKTETIAAAGHQWSDWTTTKDPTCTEKGQKQRTCPIDDVTEFVEIDMLGHTWGEWTQTKAPTCQVEGEETRECSVCHETETRTIAKVDHKYTEYTYNDDATTEKDGTETATCDFGCGTTDTKVKEGTKLPAPPTSEPTSEPTTNPTAKPTNPDNPKTGDAGSTALWIAGFAFIAMGAAITIIVYKKKVKN